MCLRFISRKYTAEYVPPKVVEVKAKPNLPLFYEKREDSPLPEATVPEVSTVKGIELNAVQLKESPIRNYDYNYRYKE